MYYSYARLSRYDLGFVRLIGAGLGNMLLPWARFIVATGKHRLHPIEPTWPQIKLGPIIRGERDKRLYTDLFQPGANQIRGLRKLRLLCSLPALSEAIFEKGQNDERRDAIVIFEGMSGHFAKILVDHELVGRELISITRPCHRRGLGFDSSRSITAHIRMGDFTAAPQGGRAPGPNQRTPLGWYRRIIGRLRDTLGAQTPIYVFSDGRDDELAEILALPKAQRLGFGSSIADLLAMSQSALLLPSGSTFSMWASYLGRMPVIWPKGRMIQRLYYDRPEAEIELDADSEIPDSFLQTLERPVRRVAPASDLSARL